MTLKCTMIQGDCLEVIPSLKNKSVDMTFADFPYAQKNKTCTRHSWDKNIPIDKWWDKLWNKMKDRGQLIMTTNARLLAALITANPHMFRYDLVYYKTNSVGFLDAKKRPLRAHENMAVFGKGVSTYNPQKTKGKAYTAKTFRRPNRL